MKLALVLLCSATIAAPSAAQTIVGGPVLNPDTGHRYYLIDADSWTDAESWAVARGGHLASIQGAAENAWILANIANLGGNDYKLFIGLNDASAEGSFVWTSGEPLSYTNWENNQPASDDYGLLNPLDGKWSMRPVTYSSYACIEIAGPLRVPSEYATIEAAFAAAELLPGPDTIEVGPGDFQMVTRVEPTQPVTLRGAGAGLTTIRGFPSNFPFAPRSTLTFEDIAFVHGDVTGGYTLVLNYNHPFVAKRCIFTGIRADGESGPIGFPVNGGTARFEGCHFRNLEAAAISNDTISIVLLNCVLDQVDRIVYSVWTDIATLDACNCTFRNVGDGTELVGPYWDARIVNCVFSNISGDPDRNGVQIDYSLLPVEIPGGVGNLMGFPQFVDANAGDYRLRPGTIGVDAGSISRFLALAPSDFLDFGGRVRAADDGAAANLGPGVPPIDMGAHEVQPCIADINGDGLLNIFDFLAFQTIFGNGC